MKVAEYKYTNYLFNPELSHPYNRIHPLQVKKVYKFLQGEFCARIKRIILFGSSIDLTCHPGSDIDLYVICENELEETQEFLYQRARSLNLGCDFVIDTQENYDFFANQIGTVEYDVYREGVTIYVAR